MTARTPGSAVNSGFAVEQGQDEARRQPPSDQRSQLRTMQAALRMQESGSYEGDYSAQSEWIESQRDKAMGAYGMMSKSWNSYTNAAGIAGANWRDPRSQDRVAGQMVEKLAGQFGGNWGLVAAAWFAGAGVAQRAADKYGYEVTTEQIREVLGDTVGNYAQQVTEHGAAIAESPYGIENNLPNFSTDVGFITPAGPKKNRQASTPQDAVRQRLVALAGMGTMAPVEPAPELAPEPEAEMTEETPI